MDGRLWVESAAGSGGTFYFTARFVAVEARVPVAASHPRQMPVLVVDDNATNRHLLDEMLNSGQMVPTLVSSGPAALAALRGAIAPACQPASVVPDLQPSNVLGSSPAPGFGLQESPNMAQACESSGVIGVRGGARMPFTSGTDCVVRAR
jgi:hypothetical protein